MTLTPQKCGWIELICGSMFSGKTEELIRRLIRAQIAQQNVAIFKPKLDNRYDEEYITSHNQRKIKSIAINDINDIKTLSKNSNVVGIDEAQFFDHKLISICKELSKNGKRVVIAGLEKDYQAIPLCPEINFCLS